MSYQVHTELSQSDLMDHKATKAVSPFTQDTIIYVVACLLMRKGTLIFEGGDPKPKINAKTDKNTKTHYVTMYPPSI